MHLTAMTDEQLIQSVTELARVERVNECAMLRLLGEIDLRKLYAPAGKSSMFAYCVEILKFSESTTSRRVAAARLAREFPVVLTLIEDGRLSLTTAGMIAPHATGELIAAAAGKSTREVDALVAAVAGRKEKKDSIRPVAPRPAPPRATPPPPPAMPLVPIRDETAAVLPASIPPALNVTAPPMPPPVEPVRQRVTITFTADAAFAADFERAAGLLAHKFPDSRMEDVLGFALERLLATLDPAKPGKRGAPIPRRERRRGKAGRDSRYIPVAVRRIVWQRDGGQCTFVGEGGVRCSSRRALQYDHVHVGWAEGGRSDDPANLALACSTHNGWRAFQKYGPPPLKNQRELFPSP